MYNDFGYDNYILSMLYFQVIYHYYKYVQLYWIGWNTLILKLFYSCNQITKTLIQISRYYWIWIFLKY